MLPLLEGRNGSSSPGGEGACRRGSSSERSVATPRAAVVHHLWDDTAAVVRTPPSAEALVPLPQGSLSKQLQARPRGGTSPPDGTGSSGAAEMRPIASSSQRQLHHLRGLPAGSTAASKEIGAEADGEQAQQRKRKAASPLTSVEESADGEVSTSSIGSEVSSASAFGWAPSPSLNCALRRNLPPPHPLRLTLLLLFLLAPTPSLPSPPLSWRSCRRVD